MKRSGRKLSPWQAATILAGSTFLAFWLSYVIGVAVENNWKLHWGLLCNALGTHLINFVVISTFVGVLMFLMAKYGLKFISWSVIGLGIIIFLASSKGGYVPKLIADFLGKSFDIRMLASSIGVISFGLWLLRTSAASGK